MELETIVIEETGGLGAIELVCPRGGWTVTPASRLAVETVGRHREWLYGVGLDWGSGVGSLAIAAAKLPAVKRVVGLEIAAELVDLALRNARANGVTAKVEFLCSDDFQPRSESDRALLEALIGEVDFLVANPPASRSGDGLDWRRAALRGSRRFLKPGGALLVQISYQYSSERMRGLADEVPGIVYEGLLAHSPWMPFDQDRPDLRRQVEEYVAEEERGGRPYTFADPVAPGQRVLDARQALRRFRERGEHPLSRWEMHLYRHRPG